MYESLHFCLEVFTYRGNRQLGADGHTGLISRVRLATPVSLTFSPGDGRNRRLESDSALGGGLAYHKLPFRILESFVAICAILPQATLEGTQRYSASRRHFRDL